jgi:hypothetical protein
MTAESSFSRPSGQLEIVLVQVRQRDVLQRDGVRGIERDHHVAADLRACGLNRRKVGKQAVLDFDHVVAARSRREVGDGVEAEAGLEDERVVVRATGQGVVARPADDDVIPTATIDSVIAGAANGTGLFFILCRRRRPQDECHFAKIIALMGAMFRCPSYALSYKKLAHPGNSDKKIVVLRQVFK